MADHLDGGDFGAAEEALAAVEGAFAEINRAYIERRGGKLQDAMARLSRVARERPELRVPVSIELSICYALSGTSGAARILLPEDDRRATLARAIVLARKNDCDPVLATRPPRVPPWWRRVLRHERRLFAVISAFCLEQRGDRPDSTLLALATPAFDAEYAYVRASWPEMAAFLSRRRLDGTGPRA